MFKRVGLFLVVNVLVVLTISISLQLLGVRPYLAQQGIDYTALLIFCSVFGFVGAFVSLAMSKWMAKTMMGVQVIDPENIGSQTEKFLVTSVHQYAQNAGLSVMPEVGVYDSPEVNAFATGPGRNNSLVAVSTGLLHKMDTKAIQGVIAHEVAHIANGDMVTMTLLQGIVNTFVMFFARIAAFAVANALRGDRDDDAPPPYFLHMMLVFVFEIILSILGSIVVAYFSRVREYKADSGGAQLAGADKMIHALETLKSTIRLVDGSHQSMASFKISGGSTFMKLLATHPDLDDRIAKLRSH